MNNLLDAAIAEMKKDESTDLYCSHVDSLGCAPSCCSSCHEDNELGCYNLYETANEKIPVDSYLCCTKRNWLKGI